MKNADDRQFYQANVICLRTFTIKIIVQTKVFRREYQIE